jgi:signal transduction histidine kinase
MRCNPTAKPNMERKIGNIQRYAAELDEIARLDRYFYLNSAPSRSERASYALRQEHLNEIRNRFSPELGLIQDQRNIAETFRLRIRDNTSRAEIVSAPQCMLTHDLNNGLGVVIGRCQILSELVPKDETIQRHLNGILEAARKMAIRMDKCVCQNRRQS